MFAATRDEETRNSISDEKSTDSLKSVLLFGGESALERVRARVAALKRDDEATRKTALETIASFLKIGSCDPEIRAILEDFVLENLPCDASGKPATPEARLLVYELARAAAVPSRCADLTEFGRDFEVDDAALSAYSLGVLPEALKRKLDVDAVAQRWKDETGSWAALIFAKRQLESEFGATDDVYERFAVEIESEREPFDLPETEICANDGSLANRLFVALWEDDFASFASTLKNLCPQATLNRVAESNDASDAVDWLDVCLAGFCDSARGLPLEIDPLLALETASTCSKAVSTSLEINPFLALETAPQFARMWKTFAQFKRATARLANPNASEETKRNACAALQKLSENGFQPAATACYAFSRLGGANVLPRFEASTAPLDPTDPVAAFFLLCFEPESEVAKRVTRDTKAKIKETLVYRAALEAAPRRLFEDAELIERFQRATGFDLSKRGIDWNEFERALKIGLERNPGGERTVGAYWALARTAARRGDAKACVQATRQALEATRSPDKRRPAFEKRDADACRQDQIERAVAAARQNRVSETSPPPSPRRFDDDYRKKQIERAAAAQMREIEEEVFTLATRKPKPSPPPSLRRFDDDNRKERIRRAVAARKRETEEEEAEERERPLSEDDDFLLRLAAMVEDAVAEAVNWCVERALEGPRGWLTLVRCALITAGIIGAALVLITLLCPS